MIDNCDTCHIFRLLGRLIKIRSSRCNNTKDETDIPEATKDETSEGKEKVPDNLRGKIVKWEQTNFYRPVNPVTPVMDYKEIKLHAMENVSSTTL